MRYFINGMFLQQGEGIGVCTVPGAGSVAVFETKTRGYIFSGLIRRLTPSSPWSGWVLDYFGYAELINIAFGNGELRFTKKYEGRQDEIHYAVRVIPDGEQVLIGHYQGVDTGKNAAWCLLTEVPDSIFDEHAIKALAGQTPKLSVVTLVNDEVAAWNEYKRASGLLPAGETPRVNSTVLLHDTRGNYLATAYLTEHDMIGGRPDGQTKVTVSATVRTRFS